jgi:tetratricopeptide (TPR) repeat protein
VLENLVDIEAPSRIPMPMTEAPGVTQQAEGTVDIGSRGRRTSTPTRITGSGRTVVGSDQPTVLTDRPDASGTRLRGARRTEEPQRSRALVWAAAGVVLVLAAAGMGALVWSLRQPAAAPAALGPSSVPSASPTAAAAASVAPPVTAAPQPTFAPVEGRGAAQMRAAQAAFRARDYVKAAARAQEALAEDPGHAAAKAMLEQAIAGQSAAARIAAGETALTRGDYAAAEREAAAALQAAPWERAAVELRAKVEAARLQAQREAESRAQSNRAAQVNAFMNEATADMQARRYDAAIAAYDKALALDPANPAAQMGKQSALGAKSITDAAAAAGSRAPAQPEHGFASGKTETKASADASAGPVGFSDSPTVVVKKGTQAAEMPGRILFEAAPQSPKGGDRVRIVVSLANDGNQPIPVARMIVTTTIDGRKQQGPVPPSATSVAPGGKAVVWQMPEYIWKDATSLWSMEILVFTSKGDSYRNTLTWK